MLKFPRRRSTNDTPAYDGHLDIGQAGILHGWACNHRDPSKPVRVRIVHDGATIGEAEANIYREDLRAAGIGAGHGKYAFCFYVPSEIRALENYSLHALADGVWELKDSPATTIGKTIQEEVPPYDGHVDLVQGGILQGWACNNLNPSRPVKVQIHQNGAVIGEVMATAYRRDLAEGHIGGAHGNYGFCFYVPAEIRAQQKYVLRAFADGVTELRGSPTTVFEPSEYGFRTAGPHVRDFLAHQYLHGEGIEIGALDKPTKVPEGTVVKYVDSKPPEKLEESYQTEMHGHAITKVDIVADAQTLEGVESGSQDFVIANQVLEHLENTLLALENMLRVVKPGGVVFLSLPDKRYTFDAARPVTSFAHILEDYRSGPERGREAHYREWVELVEKRPPEQVSGRVHELMDIENYSIHFHVWTQFEMFELFERARAVLPIAYEIDCFKASEAEALFVLRRL